MAKAVKPKPKIKKTDKKQSDRFREAVRTAGLENEMESFDEKFRKIVPPKKRPPKPD